MRRVTSRASLRDDDTRIVDALAPLARAGIDEATHGVLARGRRCSRGDGQAHARRRRAVARVSFALVVFRARRTAGPIATRLHRAATARRCADATAGVAARLSGGARRLSACDAGRASTARRRRRGRRRRGGCRSRRRRGRRRRGGGGGRFRLLDGRARLARDERTDSEAEKNDAVRAPVHDPVSYHARLPSRRAVFSAVIANSTPPVTHSDDAEACEP
jgi:hypothetical protein